jgi:class 3 adenylate cyclase
MDIYYPIINDISQVKTVGREDYDVKNNSLVALLVSTVYWRNLIRDALSPGSNGITVLFNNTCTKSFTYQVNGPDAVFIGVNDQHEMKYDNLRVSRKITDLEKSSFATSAYSGAPISETHCPYTLHIYPTDVMRSEFSTSTAAVSSALTLLVIIGIGIVFILYDVKVENRQKKVLSSAMRSSEIVSSLFPTSVQDQLYPITDKEKNGCDDGAPAGIGPIATLYPETTVMFAGIKGFTKWSSTREPTKVFCLLETLYGEFDALAKLSGVFKVETIGDTYVAVVGLPNARKHHALVMARFAQKCIGKMASVTKNLETILGPVRLTCCCQRPYILYLESIAQLSCHKLQGTIDLSLRIGLNSGPTTAGVLRGEKARFQLFGDVRTQKNMVHSSFVCHNCIELILQLYLSVTSCLKTVNTAARMESNGESNRIQVSESTARLIEINGKG